MCKFLPGCCHNPLKPVGWGGGIFLCVFSVLTSTFHSFFAVLNVLFLPILYFLYPETSGRSLEEIDIIFAKGYDEKTSYVKAAQNLPRLTDAEVHAMAREYGFSTSSDDESNGNNKNRHTEKEGVLADNNQNGALMA